MKKIISLLLAVVMVLGLLCVGAYATSYYSMTITLSGPGNDGVTQTVTRTSGSYLTANDKMIVTLAQAMYNDGVHAEIERKYATTGLYYKYMDFYNAAMDAINGDAADWNVWVDNCVAKESHRTLLKNMSATLSNLASVGGLITATYTGGNYTGLYTLTIKLNTVYVTDPTPDVPGGDDEPGGEDEPGEEEDEDNNKITLNGDDGTATEDGTTTVVSDGGTTTVSVSEAPTGTSVTITAVPEEEQMVNYVDVRDSDGNKVTLTYDGDGNYTFDMPEGGVTITATYRIEPENPEVTGVSKVLNISSHDAYMKGDTTGYFRPKDNITRAEVAQIFYRLLLDDSSDGSKTFSDVKETSWYAEAVNTLASKGILNGVTDSSFQPGRAITRAEFAAICVRFADSIVKGNGFSDVSGSYWAADEISTAAEFGWILGYEDGTFAPDKPITREEAAAIVNRVLYRLGDQIAIDSEQGKYFPDVNDRMWSWYEINEATEEHDYTYEDGVAHEYWQD